MKHAGQLEFPDFCAGQVAKTKQPTREQIEAGRTPRGGWSRRQLAEWGVSWPPPHGWKQTLEQVADSAASADGDAVEQRSWAAYRAVNPREQRSLLSDFFGRTSDATPEVKRAAAPQVKRFP